MSTLLFPDLLAAAAHVSRPHLQAHVELLAQECQRETVFPGDPSNTAGEYTLTSAPVPKAALPETL